MSKTFKIFTLGCKVNQYDSQSIRERFKNAGFEETVNGTNARYCIINTCTVTASADRKARYIIRHCVRKNPRSGIIVTGCLAKKDEESLSGIKGVDFVIGKRFFPDGISDFEGHTRAFLKVQDGCNNRCSYCKVPLVRGYSRSRELAAITRDASALAARSFKEIVLTGICLGAYGQDLSPRLTLVDVITVLEQIEAFQRIRLSSIEASDISDDLIEKMAVSKKLCPHLHIPIQSGDDTVLKNMNRKYRRKDYLHIIKKIKKRVPGIAITTDIMVGFPGETDAQFNNTLDLVKKIVPLRTHIFPYSPREGTPAIKMGQGINPGLAQERILILREIAGRSALKFQKLFINKKMEVLIEERRKGKPDYWEGYTGNYLKILVKSRENLKNRLVQVDLNMVKCEEISGALYHTDGVP